jgi:hypothetical protein
MTDASVYAMLTLAPARASPSLLDCPDTTLLAQRGVSRGVRDVIVVSYRASGAA